MGGVTVSLFFYMVVEEPVSKSKRRSLYDWWRDRFGGQSPLQRRLPISDVLGSSHSMPLSVEVRGKHSTYLTPDAEAFVELLGIDLIMNFTNAILRGPILTLPTHGVWSFHHGNPREFRGAPPGFWEIYYDAPWSGAILQRLEERLDDGIILRSATLPTIAHSYSKQREQLFSASIHWPAEVAKELVNGATLPSSNPEPPSNAPITRNPTNLQTLYFWLKLLKAKIRRFVCRTGSRSGADDETN